MLFYFLTAIAGVAYLSSLAYALHVSAKSENWVRCILFVVLFYLIAPLLPFSDFRFFAFSVNYSYRYDIFILYAVSLTLITLILQGVGVSNSIKPIRLNGYFVYLAFAVSAFALLNDIRLNLDYVINYAKEDFLAGEVKFAPNFFVITIPGGEILLGMALMHKFHNHFFKYAVWVLAAIALCWSFVNETRHLVFVFLVLLLVPRLRILGFVGLLFLMSFAGELSNFVKFLIAFYMSGVNFEVKEYLAFFVGELDFMRFSTEQMAILSNLIIKLDYLGFSSTPSVWISLLPYGHQLLGDVGYEFSKNVHALGAFVGVGAGQGVAYSFNITLLETPIPAMITLLLLVLLGKYFGSTFILFAIVTWFHYLMRNDLSYTLFTIWLFLIVFGGLYLISLAIKFMIETERGAARLKRTLQYSNAGRVREPQTC